jgi:hypothetical protein
MIAGALMHRDSRFGLTKIGVDAATRAGNDHDLRTHGRTKSIVAKYDLIFARGNLEPEQRCLTELVKARATDFNRRPRVGCDSERTELIGIGARISARARWARRFTGFRRPRSDDRGRDTRRPEGRGRWG